jgi:hypothetical protein
MKFRRYKLKLKEDREAFHRKELQMRFVVNEAQQRCAILDSLKAGSCICSIYQIGDAFEKWLIICTNQNKSER